MENKIKALCTHCRDYLNDLPSHEHDIRSASLVVWCLAYEYDDYTQLSFYWRKVLGTLLSGLRLTRVGTGARCRSEEVTNFCTEFIEYLWDKHSRHSIALQSSGAWQIHRFDFQQCYDSLWTVWGDL